MLRSRLELTGTSTVCTRVDKPASRARRLRQHQIGAAAEEAGQAGGRDAEGLGVEAAEQARALVALRDIDEIARHQKVAVEGALVAREAQLVLKPALDEIEAQPRQPALGHAAQIFNVDGFVRLHPGVLSSRRAAAPPHPPVASRRVPPSPATLPRGERGRLPTPPFPS